VDAPEAAVFAVRDGEETRCAVLLSTMIRRG
jgi:hypothetical protein